MEEAKVRELAREEAQLAARGAVVDKKAPESEKEGDTPVKRKADDEECESE